MVNKTSSTPMYVQLQNALYEQIQTGELPPGAQVPSEQELCSRYGVSRMTARKALDALVTRGLLYRQQGKGTFVAQGVLSYGLSNTQSFSQTLRAAGYDVSTTVLRQAVVAASDIVARELNLPPGSDVILIRRLRHVNGQPAAIHSAYLDYRRYAALLNADLTNGSLLTAVSTLSGQGSFSSSVNAVQAMMPTPDDAVLLEVDDHTPVLVLEGTSYSENNLPTYYTVAIYRGDRFKLMVANSNSQAVSIKWSSRH